MTTDYKHSEITEKIIGSAYKVYNTLGFGFLEKVYENALAVQLRKLSLPVEHQVPLSVAYEVGATMLVEVVSVDRSHALQVHARFVCRVDGGI